MRIQLTVQTVEEPPQEQVADALAYLHHAFQAGTMEGVYSALMVIGSATMELTTFAEHGHYEERYVWNPSGTWITAEGHATHWHHEH